MTADPVRPQETLRDKLREAIHGARKWSSATPDELIDVVLPIVEEETKALREKLAHALVHWNSLIRSADSMMAERNAARGDLAALRAKVKARAERYDEIGGSIACADPLPCDGCDYTLIAADLRALVEEPQGGQE